MALKVYQKRGKLNYKERRMIAEIEEAIAKKYGTDPSISERFIPAKDFDQLKELHTRYCIEDTPFEEVSSSQDKSNVDVIEKGGNDDRDIIDTSDEYDDDGSFIDPLNREEPIVRDYVLDEDASTSNNIPTGPAKTSFDEPLSFDEAFEIPGETTTAPKKDSNSNNQNTQSDTNTQGGQRKQDFGGGNIRRESPLNPNFDDMSQKKKRKSTQRFAKYIVETICLLAEKGFVWYANKDINESKLAEYEISGEIDLSLMVTLENGQEATIKQFFSVQCIKAEELAIIGKEEKEDLIDALAEVLMEKGVAPTPIQELMMISLKILGGQAVKLIALKSQTNDLLSQLRAMKAGDTEAGQYVEQERPKYQEPVRQEPIRQQEPVKQEPIKETSLSVVDSTEEEDEQFLLGDSKETME
jgi:hypothetical protein